MQCSTVVLCSPVTYTQQAPNRGATTLRPNRDRVANEYEYLKIQHLRHTRWISDFETVTRRGKQARMLLKESVRQSIMVGCEV